MLFREYVRRRLLEDTGMMTIDGLRSMILQSLQANPDSKEAYNSPLIQWDKPINLLRRFNSMPGLTKLIQSNPAAMEAIQSADRTKLTVGELAGILLNSQSNVGNNEVQ